MNQKLPAPAPSPQPKDKVINPYHLWNIGCGLFMASVLRLLRDIDNSCRTLEEKTGSGAMTMIFFGICLFVTLIDIIHRADCRDKNPQNGGREHCILASMLAVTTYIFNVPIDSIPCAPWLRGLMWWLWTAYLVESSAEVISKSIDFAFEVLEQWPDRLMTRWGAKCHCQTEKKSF